jgi:hypothetical protein
MQSPSLPSVVFEQKLLDSADKSLLYGAVLADSLTNAIDRWRKNREAADGGGHRAAVLQGFSRGPGRKTRLVGESNRRLPPLKFNPPDPRRWNVYDLSRTLFYTFGYLGNALGGGGQPTIRP